MCLRGIFAVLRKYVYQIIRDIRFLSGLVPALVEVKRVSRRTGWSVLSFWEETVQSYGPRTAIVFGDRLYNFLEVDALSNKRGRAALASGLAPGDTVALLLENRPEYVFWFLGLCKVGVTTALLNTNVRGEGLAHCIKACGARQVLFSKETAGLVESLSIGGELENVAFACIDPEDDTLAQIHAQRECSFLDCAPMSDGPLPSNDLREDTKRTDPLLHIFTSGTTGRPKAAKISHLRFFGSSLIFSKLCRFVDTDVIYCPLPFYHSSAVVLGLGLSWHNGLPFVSRSKFSTSEFWKDCVMHKVTVIQYIGELCRYLLVSAPPDQNESKHSVRLALGNGLRPDVWTSFQQRFDIDRIIEFYASTEGNVGLVNTESRVGAIGFLSPLLAKKHPGKLLLFDYDNGAPIRNEQGRCVECKPGEIGEFVGMINKRDITQRFDGYSEKKETERKILRDVIEVGDECFRSGDLMTKDEEGFIYFIDRIGDTFRWKGENVSTTEVEGIIGACKGVKECIVYGVEIKGQDGKAGMALVRVADINDLPILILASALFDNLPEFARPVFVRFTTRSIDTTSTFKHRKCHLMQDGLVGPVAKDEMSFIRKKSSYVKLTDSIYREVLAGSLRL